LTNSSFKYQQLNSMLEEAERSVAVWHPRSTLLAACELAGESKGHTPRSRARLKAFRRALEAMEGDDEIEVAAEPLREALMHAMETVMAARGRG
jgi:hypothetical protein